MLQVIMLLVVVALVAYAVIAAYRDMSKKKNSVNEATGFALGETFKTFKD